MSEHAIEPPGSQRGVLIAIAAALLTYGAAALASLPQRGTEMVLKVEHPAGPEAALPLSEAPAYWMVTPFVLLLGAIALLPLFHFSEHWWESNGNKFLVAGGLGVWTLAYYALVHAHPVECHFLGQGRIERPDGLFSW
jgi:hypothetical protein